MARENGTEHSLQEGHAAQLRLRDDENIPPSHCSADEERVRRKREQGSILDAHFHALSQLNQTVGCIERRITRPTLQSLSRDLSLAEQLLAEDGSPSNEKISRRFVHYSLGQKVV